MEYLNDEFEVLLSAFINHKISRYTSMRNYDYGPSDRSNVSLLSKFLSHRLLLEYELINYIKKKTSSSINFKFIDEIIAFFSYRMDYKKNFKVGLSIPVNDDL